jgi:CheY-like chemotaxis protein
MIFMDLIMPEMDGFEATLAIHAQPSTAHMPVIAVSANIDDRFAALEAGMIAFIPKPWYESEIQSELRKAWPTKLEVA